MLTDRDGKIIRFIDDFGCADTETIYNLYFSGLSRHRCTDRLKQLTEQHHLSRIRGNVNADYTYFVGKQPKQIQHNLVRATFYTRMKASYNLISFVPEFAFEKLRADAYMKFNLFSEKYAAFVEVQLSSGNVQDKYETLYQAGGWQSRWTSFPLVIIVTNRRQNIRQSKIKYIVMDADRMSMDVIRNSLYPNVIQRNTAFRRAAI